MSPRAASALALGAIGLLSLPTQVVLLRELSVAFYGVELVYLLGLGAWLAWTAAGSLLGRAGAGAGAPPAFALALLGVVIPASVVLLRAGRRLLLGLPGADLPFGRGLLLLALCLMPAGLLLGVLFRRAARRAQAEGATLAEAYALEGAGAVVGGVLTTLALASRLDALSLAVASGSLALGIAAALAERRACRFLFGIAGAAGVASLPAAPGLDQGLTRLNHPGLTESRDSPYARLSLVRQGEQAVLLVDDAAVYESEGTAAETFVHPALVQARPGRVLVLGGCAFGLLAEVARHAPETLSCVELDAELLELGRKYLPAGGPSAPAADVRVTVADPRRFLEQAGRFDAIVIGAPAPESGQASRFYTREFFELCSRRLAPGGILGLRLSAGESYWAPLLARRMGSVAGALAAAFPDTLLLPGDPTVLLGGARLERDPAVLAERLRARGITPRLAGPAYLAYAYDPGRLDEVAARLRSAGEVSVNTDDRPVAYGHAARLWLSRFFPRLAFETGEPPAARRWALVAAPAALLLLLAPWLGRADRLRRSARMAVAGFAGMALECVLLLRFQSARGALFQDLGLLITAFMAGLVAGSALAPAWAARRGRRLTPRAARTLLLAIAGLAALLAVALRQGIGGGLATTASELLLAATLVGAVLAETSSAGFARPEDAIAVYAADLAGACLGCLFSGLLLVPAAGLAATAAATAALCLAAAVLAS